MNIRCFRHATPLLMLGILPAQDPAAPPSPHRDRAVPTLQSLQALVTESVFVRQATGANGSADPLAHDVPLARVHDAAFDADGKLDHFVVTAPPNTKAADTAPRRLPAHAVHWHAATKRWLTVEPTLQWAELEVLERPAPDKEPAIASKPVLRMASALLRVTCSDTPPDKAVEASSPGDLQPRPSAVFWFAAEARQLAIACVPRDGKHLLLPYSVLRIDGNGAALRLSLPPATQLDNAPAAEDPNAPPDQATRARCREHFGVAPPAWDQPPAPADGQGEGKAKERAPG